MVIKLKVIGIIHKTEYSAVALYAELMPDFVWGSFQPWFDFTCKLKVSNSFYKNKRSLRASRHARFICYLINNETSKRCCAGSAIFFVWVSIFSAGRLSTLR